MMGTTIEDVVKHLQREFATARDAVRKGNEGMARVCARRAAGAAISYWIRENGKRDWAVDAMSQLRRVGDEPAMPAEVRAAATRLAARVTPHATSRTTDPLNDCRVIIGQFLGEDIAALL